MLRRDPRAQRADGLPDIQVAALDARHLEVLARAAGARRAVEIGTLGGYSGVSLLRGMGPKRRRSTPSRSIAAPRRGRARELPPRRLRRRVPASTSARRRGPAQAGGRRPVRSGLHRRRQGGLPRLPRLGGRQPASGRPRAARQRLPVRRPPRPADRRSRRRRSARCRPCTRSSPAAASSAPRSCPPARASPSASASSGSCRSLAALYPLAASPPCVAGRGR